MSATVIYCDGGCREGLTGWGVYIDPQDPKEKTISGCGGFGNGTNNTAELKAFIEAAKWVIKNNKNRVLFLLDSQYVIKGVKYQLNIWVKNNWLKQDGTALKNVELWKEIHGLIEQLNSNERKWKIDYVPGHSNDKGNDKADALATRGISHSKDNLPDYWSDTEVEVSEDQPKKKKFKKQDAHPLLWTKRAMFLTGKKDQEHALASKFGYNHLYMLAEYEDKEELKGSYLAKPNGSACFGLLLLKEEEPLLEVVRKRQEDIDHGGYNVVVQYQIPEIVSKETQEQYAEHDAVCLREEGKCVSLWGTKLLTRYMVPALRASFGLQQIDQLSSILESYCNKEFAGQVYDITDLILVEAKKNFEVHKTINDSVPVIANITINGQSTAHKLTHGIDIPPRNPLQRLAKGSSQVSIQLVIYDHNEHVYGSCVVIETESSLFIMRPSEAHTRIVVRKGR